MRLLVVGGAGYIGRVVANLLLQEGHEIIVLDNLSSSRQEDVPVGVLLRRGDFGNQGLLDELLPGVDAVLHFAASIEVGESMLNPIKHFQNNTAKTIGLLDAMCRHRVERFIFSSTAAIYGQPESIPVLETHPLRPANPYGESKLMIERVLSWMAARGSLRYASLRYFNAAGGRLGRKAVNLIPIALEAAQGTRPFVEIYGTDYPTRDGTAVRDYVHVGDLATAHLLALEALASRHQLTYNLGSERGFTVREVIRVVEEVTGNTLRVVECPRRPGDPAEMVASSQLIREELGWRPEHPDLRTIVASAWDTLDLEGHRQR